MEVITLQALNGECQDEKLKFCRVESSVKTAPQEMALLKMALQLLISSEYLSSSGVLLHTIDATTPAEQESLLHQEICFELYQSKYTLRSTSQLKITRI